MAILGRMVLALLALGMQLPAQLSLPLCLCGVLPFTCSEQRACAAPDTSPGGCCAAGVAAEQARERPAEESASGGRGSLDAGSEPKSCCGCEVHLGGSGNSSHVVREADRGHYVGALAALVVAGKAPPRPSARASCAAAAPRPAEPKVNGPLRI